MCVGNLRYLINLSVNEIRELALLSVMYNEVTI